MRVLLNLLIFCLVLFIYIHVYFNLKTSNDLEIYEISEPSKIRLEEVCNSKQPVVFKYPNDEILNTFVRNQLLNLYGAFDIKLREVKNDDFEKKELHIPFSLEKGLTVLDKKKKQYILENNFTLISKK